MTEQRAPSPPSDTDRAGRRAAVLASALDTFARFGYRRTSMEEVARAARISRPGLYFLFASKEQLFRAAVEHALEADLAAVQNILEESDRPLRDRLLDAFDRWAGRYIGRMARDVSALMEDDPELFDGVVDVLPQRFSDLLTDALASEGTRSRRELAAPLAQTINSTSIGIKHQVDTRDAFLQRLAVAIDLLLRG